VGSEATAERFHSPAGQETDACPCSCGHGMNAAGLAEVRS
jgi:hypothetical protein